MGRRAEARSAFRDLANSEKFDNRNDEYARLYAQMYVSYLEDDLIEADRLARELNRLDCRPAVKRLLIAHERPSLLAADSLLSSLRIKEADPLGFRDEGSGVHWMNAVEAYSKEQFAEALDKIEQATVIRAPNSSQRAVKASILLHLDRAEEASPILKKIREELNCPSGVDEHYLRLICEVYLPSVDASASEQALKDVRALEPESDLRHFLAVGDDDEVASLKAYFKSLRAAYENRSLKITWGEV